MGIFFNEASVVCPIYNGESANRVFFNGVKVYDMTTTLKWSGSTLMSGVSGVYIFTASGKPNGPSFSISGGQLLMLRDIPILRMSGTINGVSVDGGNGAAGIYIDQYRDGKSIKSLSLGSAGSSQSSNFNITSSLSGTLKDLVKGDKIRIRGHCSIAGRIYNSPTITFTATC